MQQTSRAIEHLTTVIARHPTAPANAELRAQVLLGTAYDHLGDRERALTAYKSALALTSTGDNADTWYARARSGLQRPATRR